MASLVTPNNDIPMNQIEIPIEASNPSQETNKENNVNYSQRAQWLRAAVLGANDGLVSVTSLMMGVGAVNQDIATMLLAGFAGLVAGACSMAIGEFVSVYTQYDIEDAQMKREREVNNNKEGGEDDDEELPNPFQAALASAIAFSVGAVVPLLAAMFVRDYKIRTVLVVVMASLSLLVFGGVGAVLGKTLVLEFWLEVGWLLLLLLV